ncbi:hypothetical protein J5X92_20455 [Alteromonas sp. K632G]|jgi:hypothetical protein|uniref:Uncharacterized protein n=1 Tax=Alteromonas naphthalenivorans TaxID=715451 RepID=F5ZET6_ALTNA|nr:MULTISPECIES: hypothetical protein [Alteromonas]AEF04636.1 hypothetical protein ambt_15630 [Alteromonas naphthalenivorans]MBO7924575.1 hypothetical protein [Alteromonas sp. K632G]|tara:strand:- start:59 stop:337 length:279 start_codon:yes stop_codon:yes gene_type:complete
MKHSEEQLFKAVDEILFYLWDPLDCKEIPAARDEYRSYVPKVLDYLTSDNNEEKIAKYLAGLEINSMGRSVASQNSIEIARILIEAKDWCFG